jgi:putative transcriptional regulator
MIKYHYTESGLKSVWLANGFEIVASAKGTGVKIHDIDGLHAAIGRSIVERSKRLSGEAFRFLRTELLFSQARLAAMLVVKELTVGRWERDQVKIPAIFDAALRTLYQQKVNGNAQFADILHTIANLEAEADNLVMKEDEQGWSRAA